MDIFVRDSQESGEIFGTSIFFVLWYNTYTTDKITEGIYMVKTNAMRLLDSAKIKYDLSEYEVDENDLSGVHGAEMLGIDPDCMFKNARMCGRKR